MTHAPSWTLAIAAALALTSPGCIKTTTHKLARLQPTAAVPTTQPVRESGAYHVRVREPGKKDYRRVDGTWRLLRAGDPVGFARGQRGELYAIAGADRLPLCDLGDWERLMWYTAYPEQTQFSREVNEAVAAAGNAAGAAAIITVNALLEDECDDDDDEYWKRRFKEEQTLRNRRN